MVIVPTLYIVDWFKIILNIQNNPNIEISKLFIFPLTLKVA